jgi:SH3-like domain-containing protein
MAIVHRLNSQAKQTVAHLVVGVASLFVSLPAAAQEFQSIANNAAILYDAPSATAKRLFIAPRGMPVQVVSVVEPFVKVRDLSGDLAWVNRAALGNLRTVIAISTVSLRASAADSAAIAVQFERGVVFELLEQPANGWVRLKHAEGQQGFVKTSELWGL